jgi:hypothetical protein
MWRTRGAQALRVTWKSDKRDVLPMHPETSSGIQVRLNAAGHVDALHGLPTPTVPRSTHVPRGLLAYSLTNDGILLANLFRCSRPTCLYGIFLALYV